MEGEGCMYSAREVAAVSAVAAATSLASLAVATSRSYLSG